MATAGTLLLACGAFAAASILGAAPEGSGRAPTGAGQIGSTSAPTPPPPATVTRTVTPTPAPAPVIALAGATREFPHVVAPNMPMYFNTFWTDDADVVMTLTSPSGRLIDRNTVTSDVVHDLGPTHERYEVTNPEAGTWTVQLFGARVPPEGTETRLGFFQEPVPNQDPVARMTLTEEDDSVTVDASESYDPDGVITEYFWDFGDGAVGTGVRATHTYTKPGDYLVAMDVTDSAGGMDFTAADHVVHVAGG